MRAGAALLATLALALAAAAPAAGIDRPLTIRLVSSLVSLREIDAAPKGRAGPGDGIFTVSRLRNGAVQFGRQKNAVVGTDRARLTLQRDGTLRISGTATLPGGTIRFDGRVAAGAARTIVIQVVGGTGRYENARGTVAVTDLDDRGSAINVYRLVPGGANVA
jgi:hypothetical protein